MLDKHRGMARSLLLYHGVPFRAARLRRFYAEFVPPRRASKAVGLIKRAVQSGLEVPFHEGLALERELQQHLFESDDATEGLEAYVGKAHLHNLRVRAGTGPGS